jgi:hypothetical protein
LLGRGVENRMRRLRLAPWLVVRWVISSSSVERGVNYELDRLWIRG